MFVYVCAWGRPRTPVTLGLCEARPHRVTLHVMGVPLQVLSQAGPACWAAATCDSPCV